MSHIAWRSWGWHIDDIWNTWTPRLCVFSCSEKQLKVEANLVFHIIRPHCNRSSSLSTAICASLKNIVFARLPFHLMTCPNQVSSTFHYNGYYNRCSCSPCRLCSLSLLIPWSERYSGPGVICARSSSQKSWFVFPFIVKALWCKKAKWGM